MHKPTTPSTTPCHKKEGGASSPATAASLVAVEVGPLVGAVAMIGCGQWNDCAGVPPCRSHPVVGPIVTGDAIVGAPVISDAVVSAPVVGNAVVGALVGAAVGYAVAYAVVALGQAPDIPGGGKVPDVPLQ